MDKALRGAPATPFRTPPGVRLVRVDAQTGLLPGETTRTVIAEAFLPGTEPVTRTPTEPRPVDASNGTAGTTAGGFQAAPVGGGLY